MNANTKNEVVVTSTKAQVIALFAPVVTAHNTLGQAYQTALRAIMDRIPSGLGQHAQARKEYLKVMQWGAEIVFPVSGAKSVDNVLDTMRRNMAKMGYKAPQEVRSNDDKAKAERAKEASRKALNRAKAEIKKSNPKADDDVITEKAKELLAEKKAALSDAGKQAKAREAGLSVLTKLIENSKAGIYGDGDTKQLTESFAACYIRLRDFN